MTELLSPAGGWEAMVAAVQNGADAVYMGFGGLNARRSARNFTDEEFRAAVAYCHLRGVKVYLTLNTLVTDRELPTAAQALQKASDMGVDAILIQDWGVWRLAREIAPDVPLHASTQMSLHTLGGACRDGEKILRRAQGAGLLHLKHRTTHKTRPQGFLSLRASVYQKPRSLSPPQRRKKVQSFSPPHMSPEKIPLGLQTCALQSGRKSPLSKSNTF